MFGLSSTAACAESLLPCFVLGHRLARYQTILAYPGLSLPISLVRLYWDG